MKAQPLILFNRCRRLDYGNAISGSTSVSSLLQYIVIMLFSFKYSVFQTRWVRKLICYKAKYFHNFLLKTAFVIAKKLHLIVFTLKHWKSTLWRYDSLSAMNVWLVWIFCWHLFCFVYQIIYNYGEVAHIRQKKGILSNKSELKQNSGNPLDSSCHGNLLDTGKAEWRDAHFSVWPFVQCIFVNTYFMPDTICAWV